MRRTCDLRRLEHPLLDREGSASYVLARAFNLDLSVSARSRRGAALRHHAADRPAQGQFPYFTCSVWPPSVRPRSSKRSLPQVFSRVRVREHAATLGAWYCVRGLVSRRPKSRSRPARCAQGRDGDARRIRPPRFVARASRRMLRCCPRDPLGLPSTVAHARAEKTSRSARRGVAAPVRFIRATRSQDHREGRRRATCCRDQGRGQYVADRRVMTIVVDAHTREVRDAYRRATVWSRSRC